MEIPMTGSSIRNSHSRDGGKIPLSLERYEKNTIPMDKKSGVATSTAYAFDYLIGAIIASQVETPYFSDHVDAVLYAPIAFGCRNLP